MYSELPPDVKSLKQAENFIYPITVSCLLAIDPEKCGNLDRQLPANKASRFRVATTAANILKGMGYQGELGYQSFLYPHEQEVRKIVGFLIERVPRNDTQTSGFDTGGNSIQMRIAQTIQNNVNSTKKNYSILDRSTTAPNSIVNYTTYPFETASFVPFSAGVGGHNGAANSRVQALIQAQIKTTNPNEIFFKQTTQEQFWCQKQPQYTTLSSTTKQSLAPTQMIPAIVHTNTAYLLHEQRLEEKLNPQFQQQQKAAQQHLTAHIASSFKQAFQESAIQQQLYREQKLKKNDMSKIFNDDSAFNRKAQFTQENTVAITTNIDEQTGLTKEEQLAKEEEEYQMLLKQRESDLTALQQQYDNLQQSFKTATTTISTTNEQILDLKNKIANLTKMFEELQQQYKTRQHVIDFLPNAVENIEKLKQLTNNNTAKILKLNTEWEKVRNGLISEFHEVQQQYNDKHLTYSQNVEKLQRLRADIKQSGADVREKEEQYKVALEEYEKMPKTINRNVYIKRIMDIVGNIDKQNDEIADILTDIKQVQREITNKTESVKRSFAEADDLIYSTAKRTRSAVAIGIYKDLIALRDGCSQIVENVESVGKKQNNVRELEQSIEIIQDRGTLNSMQSILDDLNAIEQENQQLKAQLAPVKSKKSKK